MLFFVPKLQFGNTIKFFIRLNVFEGSIFSFGLSSGFIKFTAHFYFTAIETAGYTGKSISIKLGFKEGMNI
jgi:hypothetical protein